MARSVPAIENLIAILTNLLNDDLYLGALTTAGVTTTVCFDCNLWNNGYTDDDGTVIIPPIRTTVLNSLGDIQTELQSIMDDDTIDDYGFKTQVQRLLDIVDELINKITSLQCTANICDANIFPDFFAELVMTIIQLIEILEYLNGLMSYYEYCDCLGIYLFSLLMGKFINSITELQCFLADWNAIVMVFFQLGISATKDYVASYMPRSVIQVPQYNGPMGHACVPCPRPKPAMQVQRQYVNGGCSPCGGCTQFPC